MPNRITYRFLFEDGTCYDFDISTQSWVESAANPEKHPEWTRLGVDRCPNCPLDPARHHYCPAAVDLSGAAGKFAAVKSYTRAQVTVVAGGRTYSANCDMNTGVRSLFGLYMALSGCPIASRLRPLALRHLPFASAEETLGRVVSHYLLKQYFVYRDGGTPDWDLKELKELYVALDQVNTAFLGRLRHASERDSNLNAICDFASFARLYSTALDEMLEEDKDVFMKGF